MIFVDTLKPDRTTKVVVLHNMALPQENKSLYSILCNHMQLIKMRKTFYQIECDSIAAGSPLQVCGDITVYSTSEGIIGSLIFYDKPAI